MACAQLRSDSAKIKKSSSARSSDAATTTHKFRKMERHCSLTKCGYIAQNNAYFANSSRCGSRVYHMLHSIHHGGHIRYHHERIQHGVVGAGRTHAIFPEHHGSIQLVLHRTSYTVYHSSCEMYLTSKTPRSASMDGKIHQSPRCFRGTVRGTCQLLWQPLQTGTHRNF